MNFCDKDDNNKDNVGLYMIEVGYARAHVKNCLEKDLLGKVLMVEIDIFIHYID